MLADAVGTQISDHEQGCDIATVDDDLTGRENLVLLGRLAGLARRAARARAADLLAASA